MPANQLVEIEGGGNAARSGNIADNKAAALRRAPIYNTEINARYEMNLVAYGGILADAAFKNAACRFPEENDGHPSVAC